jgi:hypothetical protein
MALHLPQFGYAITRAYRYKWFSWLVLIGGILLTALFSVINLAAVGYTLTLEITTDRMRL